MAGNSKQALGMLAGRLFFRKTLGGSAPLSPRHFTVWLHCDLNHRWSFSSKLTTSHDASAGCLHRTVPFCVIGSYLKVKQVEHALAPEDRTSLRPWDACCGCQEWQQDALKPGLSKPCDVANSRCWTPSSTRCGPDASGELSCSPLRRVRYGPCWRPMPEQITMASWRKDRKTISAE